jgi:hypothetical protein
MKTGAYGCPLVPSKRFPGELTLACVKCGSTDITMTGCYPVYGTGPCGRGRLGDPGGLDWAECGACGHRHYREVKP